MKFSLRQIELENFKAVKGKLALDFDQYPAGLYLVAGNNTVEPDLGSNGASKSTCFVDSIYWVLTNRTIRANRPGSDVISWGEKTCHAKLVFDLNETEHQIIRSRNPNNLTVNGQKLENVDNFFSLSESALRRTILVGQTGEMFLSLRPEQKSQIFTETLDLNKWLEAADKASDKAKTIEREITKLESQIASHTNLIVTTRDQHETAVDNEEQYEAKRTQRLALITEKISEINSNIEALTKANAQSRTQSQGVRQERDKAKSDTDVSENDLAHWRARVRAIEKQISTLQTNIAVVSAKKPTLETRLKAYKTTKTCPECGQVVSSDHIAEQQQQIEKELVSLAEYTTNSSKVIDQFKQDLVEANKELKELELVEKQNQELLIEQAKLSAQLNLQQGLLEQTEKVLLDCKNETNPYIDICDQLEIRFNELREQRSVMQNTLKGLQEDLAIYEFWQKGFREIRLEQIDTTLLELEVATNRHAMSLGLKDWEIQFSTERENAKGTVAHAFTVTLYPPGLNTPIPWEAYSGGESQRWQLATTFALSEVLLARAGIETDIELLDEVTNHLSPEGIDDLMECLQERARATQRRIFVIDQHSLSSGYFDKIIMVNKTTDGVFIT